MSGRGGNDIASAFIKILDRVIDDHPGVTEIVTLSDSCVPQNRNSVIYFAMADFLSRHPNIENITMKFSTPGHSAVQDVDNMHSNIEKAMAGSEFYSPVSFLRVLLGANWKKPYCVIQLRETDFKDFQACSKHFLYKQVSFAMVAQLKFTQCAFNVMYTTCHGQALLNVDIRGSNVKTRCASPSFIQPKPRALVYSCNISKDKKSDLRSMLKYMPLVDKEYYNVILTKKNLVACYALKVQYKIANKKY